MSGYERRDGALFCEGVSLAAIAAEAGTPAYVYSTTAMLDQFEAYRSAMEDVPALYCYALKANSNLAVIKTFADAGAGADTVSGGEIERALAAGVPPSKIVFAGVAKTDDELRLALAADILQFNVESVAELRRLAELATAMGRKASVALRINPNVAANTHDKISTGRRGDKFGVDIDEALEAYQLAATLSGVVPEALHIHIGSQITSLDPFEKAYGRAAELFATLRHAGLPMKRLDLGGGFGVRYGDEVPIHPQDFAAMVKRVTGYLGCELMFEPGRSFVAEAGVLVSSVIYCKETGDRRFMVLDAGMNTLIRPAMYGSHHEIVPVQMPAANAAWLAHDVVGPICESSDVFGRDRMLPEMERGDLVAFTSAGAYGAVMASDYNSRPSPVEVLVNGDRWAVIKSSRPATVQMADDHIPDWLKSQQVHTGAA